MFSSPTPRRLLSCLGAALGWGLLAAPAAHGDAGPPPLRPTNPTFIEVQVAAGGERVGAPWKAVMLVPANGQNGKGGSPEVPAELAPWLAPTDLLDASGHYWRPTDATARDLEEGAARFFFSGRRQSWRKNQGTPFPEQFRLAVYDPKKHKTYVTDAAETRSQNANYFRADLHEDGHGSLELLPLYSPRILVSLGWPFFITLALTLVTELAIAALWVIIFRPGGGRRFGRVLLTTLAANLITVPALFLAGVLVKINVPDDNAAVLAVLVGGPVLVIVAEGLLYLAWGRLTLKHAGLLSLVANVCSVVFCCGGVWAYGW